MSGEIQSLPSVTRKSNGVDYSPYDGTLDMPPRQEIRSHEMIALGCSVIGRNVATIVRQLSIFGGQVLFGYERSMRCVVQRSRVSVAQAKLPHEISLRRRKNEHTRRRCTPLGAFQARLCCLWSVLLPLRRSSSYRSQLPPF